VAAASQGPKDLIAHGVDGLLAPVDDDEALAAAARRLIDEPDLGSRLAEAGAQRVRREFSKAHVTAEWRKLLGQYGVV
jgi:glycosyltransferase involved in cell wall biosynthesis